MLGKAIALASKTHELQKDKGGKAYILHPIRIMMRLRTEDAELMQIAILHDVVEDAPDVSLNDLTVMGFSTRVTDALELLTHDRDVEYQDYVKAVASNYDATRVKLEDLRDNSDITRLKGLRKKDFDRMEKYHRAYLFLKKTLANMEDCGY